jgi:hypothetical protein
MSLTWIPFHCFSSTNASCLAVEPAKLGDEEPTMQGKRHGFHGVIWSDYNDHFEHISPSSVVMAE